MNPKKWAIHFTWVKARVGIMGNEIADCLAKNAARSSVDNIEYRKIPISAIIKTAQETSIQLWQNEWEASKKG